MNGNEITNNDKYYEEDDDGVHGANADLNVTAGVVHQVKVLHVPDTKNPPGIILEENE